LRIRRTIGSFGQVVSGERVVFMGDNPAVAVPLQSDCQPEPVAGVALELLGRAAARQSVCEGHVLRALTSSETISNDAPAAAR